MPKIIGITTATPFDVSKLKKTSYTKAEADLRFCIQDIEITPMWSSSGSDDISVLYGVAEDTEINLKAGKTYVMSVVAPRIGNRIMVSNGADGSLSYEGDRYTGKVKVSRDMPQLNLVMVAFKDDPSYEIDPNAKIVIEQYTSMHDKVGSIEAALDGIIAIQNNLIGGGSV